MDYSNSIGTFFSPSELFADELAHHLEGKRVLEVFGGNGLLSKQLNIRGIEVKCTSIHHDMDGYRHNPFYEVENISGYNAVRKYGGDFDVLLMSYPTADSGALRAIIAWGEDKPIIYIGERTTFSDGKYPNISDLAGCACDDFHKYLSPSKFFKSYTPRGHLACAFSGYAKYPNDIKLPVATLMEL